MVPSVEQPAVKTSLLAIAILAGMATAAGIVLLMSMRHTALSRSTDTIAASRTQRPSPFSFAVTASAPLVTPSAPAPVAKASIQAIVTVTGYDSHDQPLSQANGYVYSSAGMIVTSYSAIRGASSVTVDTSNGAELSVISLMGYNPSRDLAVLAVLEGNLPSLEDGAAETVQEGEVSTVMGSNHSISQGSIGPRRSAGGVDLIRINTQAAPGSPVLNRHGKVIGLVVKRPAGANAAFAVPIHYVSDLLAEQRSLSFAQMLEETGQAPAAQ